VAKSSAARAEISLNLRAQKQDGAAAKPLTDGALPQFDRIIHERIRLGIVSALAVNESLTFNELKKLLRTTDGNLSVHARRLEEAQYISCTKSFEGRMPKTEYRLTATGKKMFERYLSHMEALIEVVRER
jgi:DNA-binding HxlR family transcriptional regulator